MPTVPAVSPPPPPRSFYGRLSCEAYLLLFYFLCPPAYHFPNDQAELERLENMYELIRMALDGRNYLAPWSQQNPPRKVLDLATGAGRWAIEMGDEFPTAEIVGIDLCPIQPTMVPPNVNFYVEDA